MAKPLSSDTPLDVEVVWLEGLRSQPPVQRLQRLEEMSRLTRRAARDAIRRLHPEASPRQWDRLFLSQCYDADLASAVVEERERRGFYGLDSAEVFV